MPIDISDCGVYAIVNLVTGECYIGSSEHLELRWTEHRSALKHGMHANRWLQRAVNEYGLWNFEFRVVDVPKYWTGLRALEQVWITTTRPAYNIQQIVPSAEPMIPLLPNGRMVKQRRRAEPIRELDEDIGTYDPAWPLVLEGEF